MQTPNPRFPWITLLIGLGLGLAGGLIYAWFVDPVEWVNISPDRLSVEDQREYVLLVAEAYVQDGDIDRAAARLSALDERDIGELVAVNADAALLRGDNADEVRALATLAEALGAHPMAVDIFSGTVAPTVVADLATPSPAAADSGIETPTPTLEFATSTPMPVTLTPTPDLFADTDLNLVTLDSVCGEDYTAGRIEVYVYDASEDGVPGIEVLVSWADGQDTFYTGLKPDIDPGYADFDMVADQQYTVTLVGLAEPVVGISSEACVTDSGRTSIPTYTLIFTPSVDLEDAEP